MKLGRRGTEACNSVVWFERAGRKLQALEMNCKDFFCFQNCYSDHLSLSTQDQPKLSSCKTLSCARSWLVKLVIAPNWLRGHNSTQRSVSVGCSLFLSRIETWTCQHVVTPTQRCDRDAIRMGVGYDLVKLAILVWFLAPFGYNASDVIFENVKTTFITYIAERVSHFNCRYWLLWVPTSRTRQSRSPACRISDFGWSWPSVWDLQITSTSSEPKHSAVHSAKQ